MLVTGASGIARATLRLAVASGARVYYTGLEEEACRELQEELGAAAAFLAGDLTEPGQAGRLVAACTERFGRLDALFNVAGTSGRRYGDGPLESCTEEGWSRTLQANLDIQYRMCREAVAIMKKAPEDERGQRGVILNMASILGLLAEPRHFSALAYGTAKGAITTMTRHIAAYYAGDGIRVNAIAPGLAATQMSARAVNDPEIVSFVKEKQRITRGLIKAEDIASVALFLLSSESVIITGQTVVCDAGWGLS